MKRMQKVLFALVAVVALGLWGANSALADTQLTTQGGLKSVRVEGHNEVVSAITMVNQSVVSSDIVSGTSITITFAGDVTNAFADRDPNALDGDFSPEDLVVCTGLGASVGCDATDGDAELEISVDGSDFIISFLDDVSFDQGEGLTLSGVRMDIAAAGPGDITATISSSGDPIGDRVTYSDPVVLVARARESLDIEIEASENALLLCEPPATAGASTIVFTATVGELWAAVFASQGQEEAAGHPDETVDQGTQIVFTVSGVNAELSVEAEITLDDDGTGAEIDGEVLGTATLQVSDGDDLEFVLDFPADTDLGSSEELEITFRVFLDSGDVLDLEEGTINLAVALGPVGDFDEDDPEILLFADNGINDDVADIVDCVTRLLYSWGVNIAGFETGIAISNTSEDDLAYEPSGDNARSAIPQNGSCVLTGYPSEDADADPTTSPTVGTPVQFTTGTIPAGSSEAFVISGLPGFSGFRGYILAVCNFLNAHSFAFITDGFGSATGPTLAQGYQALVITTGSRVISDGESRGQ